MTRKLEDIISDVSRLYGSQWGISIKEAHVLTARIQALEDKVRGLENQKFNNESRIEELEALAKDTKPRLEELMSLIGGRTLIQFSLEVQLGFLLERYQDMFPEKRDEV